MPNTDLSDQVYGEILPGIRFDSDRVHIRHYGTWLYCDLHAVLDSIETEYSYAGAASNGGGVGGQALSAFVGGLAGVQRPTGREMLTVTSLADRLDFTTGMVSWGSPAERQLMSTIREMCELVRRQISASSPTRMPFPSPPPPPSAPPW